jgi:RES domain-containing protein
MSENRSLAVLEVLVHLSDTLPDKYVLGAADIPEDVAVERIADQDLPNGWATLTPVEQVSTRRLGDTWIERQRSAVLSVPSVILGERNYVLNPAHSDFSRIEFAEPELFRFDLRLISRELPSADKDWGGLAFEITTQVKGRLAPGADSTGPECRLAL